MYLERKQQRPYRYEVFMLLDDKHRKMLKRLMIVQDVSARQLSRVAGYRSHSYMNRLLTGEARWLETEPATKIATYLGVSTTDLFILKTTTDSGHVERRKAS